MSTTCGFSPLYVSFRPSQCSAHVFIENSFFSFLFWRKPRSPRNTVLANLLARHSWLLLSFTGTERLSHVLDKSHTQ